MAYKVKLTEYSQKDFDKLDGSIRKEATKALRKLEISPDYGDPLGNKHGIDLSGYYKLRFNDRKHRIVYALYAFEEVEGEQIIRIIAIGPRENEEVYTLAFERIAQETLK